RPATAPAKSTSNCSKSPSHTTPSPKPNSKQAISPSPHGTKGPRHRLSALPAGFGAAHSRPRALERSATKTANGQLIGQRSDRQNSSTDRHDLHPCLGGDFGFEATHQS